MRKHNNFMVIFIILSLDSYLKKLTNKVFLHEQRIFNADA